MNALLKLNPASGNGFPDRLLCFMGVPHKKTYSEKATAADCLIERFAHVSFKELITHIFMLHKDQEFTYYLSEAALSEYIMDHDADVLDFNRRYRVRGEGEYIALLKAFY